MFQSDRRRQRPQTLDVDENLGAVDRVRFHQTPLALVQRAWLFQYFQRYAGFADVVQQRCFT
jgi:hypothetical protein